METVSTQRKTNFFWLGLSIFIIIIDQIFKHLMLINFSYNQPFYLAPFLNLTLAYNRGAAFSFLSEFGHAATWFFIATALIISVILCYWIYRVASKNYWLGASLALILGGAIGNLLDRIRYGYVIDFIHLHAYGWSWPIFNIADIAITVGALMLVIDIFKKKS